MKVVNYGTYSIIKPDEGNVLTKDNVDHYVEVVAPLGSESLYTEVSKVELEVGIEEPTKEDLDSLYSIKMYKKYLLDKNLEKYLLSNPMYSEVFNKEGAYYTITKEKQQKMVIDYYIYVTKMKLGTSAILKWNETDTDYVEWKEEDFLKLMVIISEHVSPILDHRHELERQLRSATTLEELDLIDIAFDYY